MTKIDATTRRPCIALMGEFSAGKSTLANLLIGSNPLPVQVIATQLPPVWITHGNGQPFRVDLENNQFPIDPNNLADAPLHDTAYIKSFSEEDIFLHCDLLDMPGISDPNMDSLVWERMISKADGVLWCSHATQAWRQSEAAVWRSLPSKLYQNSLLLLTRVDKLTSDLDRQKVIRRVKAETEGLFRDCLPISLLQATTEDADYEAWLQSGAGEFAEKFAKMLECLSEGATAVIQDVNAAEPAAVDMPAFRPPEQSSEPVQAPNEMVASVIPRRVQVRRR